ncbi:hypothetical protein HHUSO_G2413 [Huso huso]|uniref:Uncharacterized protein n=1 Tax=Huso huso TaxID=61971 RepID=A0ABR1A7B1_HUSHU
MKKTIQELDCQISYFTRLFLLPQREPTAINTGQNNLLLTEWMSQTVRNLKSKQMSSLLPAAPAISALSKMGQGLCYGICSVYFVYDLVILYV